MSAKNEEYVKTSLIIKKDIWEEFKFITKENNSDANKEIRKMIINYVKKYAKKEEKAIK